LRVLGINAVFHDPAAALSIDGRIVAAAEEERFNRRKHGKPCNPFTTWELPELAARWCLNEAGIAFSDLDAIAYSYDPSLAFDGELSESDYEPLRTFFARRAPDFMATAFPGLDPSRARFVRHHLAHAASAYLAGPYRDCSVIVLDGRGEGSSYLAGYARDGVFTELASQALPDSLGLRYEELTMHLGFHRSSDEYKVMALASYGEPIFADTLREAWRIRPEGGFEAPPIDLARLAPARAPDGAFEAAHANLAASVQRRLEELLLDLAVWVYERTGDRYLTMAGGVALNCVANASLARYGPFERVWVQPAAGDAGTALGAALYVAEQLGDRTQPVTSAALGRGFDDAVLREWLDSAEVDYAQPPDIAEAVAEILAADGVVAWFQGRSEFGPRALGHRSLLAHPGRPANVERMNVIKGREQFRPVAPMVLADRASEIFDGQLPSPYMLFVHRVRPEWVDRLPAVTHVEGTARVQTVDRDAEPLVARMLEAFERRTGLPVVVNTSLNTAGRPMVDDPRDALECFGSAPVDALAIGPYLLERKHARAASRA
jgi:carbamoyltransferase